MLCKIFVYQTCVLCVIIIIQALSDLCLPDFVRPDIWFPDFVRLCKIFVYQTCVLCVIITIQALSDLCLPDFVRHLHGLFVGSFVGTTFLYCHFISMQCNVVLRSTHCSCRFMVAGLAQVFARHHNGFNVPSLHFDQMSLRS